MFSMLPHRRSTDADTQMDEQTFYDLGSDPGSRALFVLCDTLSGFGAWPLRVAIWRSDRAKTAPKDATRSG